MRLVFPFSLATAVAVVATFLCTSSPARADARVEVEVERAEGADACPDPKTFAARVREGRTTTPTKHASGQREPSRTITVRFERTRSGYASAVRTSDGMERALNDRAPGCDGLAEATLLAVRLAFDIPEPPQDAPTAAPTTLPGVKEKEAPAPSVTRDPHPPHVELFAGGLTTFGIGSPFAPGARATAVLTLGSRALWTIGLTGFALVPQRESLGVGEVEIGVLGGGVDLCRRHRFGDDKLLVGLCGRAEMARLSGQARGFLVNEEGARPLATGSLLLRAQRRFFGPVGAFAELGGVVPIVRERFEIKGVGLVYDPPFIAATAALGAVIDFE